MPGATDANTPRCTHCTLPHRAAGVNNGQASYTAVTLPAGGTAAYTRAATAHHGRFAYTCAFVRTFMGGREQRLRTVGALAAFSDEAEPLKPILRHIFSRSSHAAYERTLAGGSPV